MTKLQNPPRYTHPLTLKGQIKNGIIRKAAKRSIVTWEEVQGATAWRLSTGRSVNVAFIEKWQVKS